MIYDEIRVFARPKQTPDEIVTTVVNSLRLFQAAYEVLDAVVSAEHFKPETYFTAFLDPSFSLIADKNDFARMRVGAVMYDNGWGNLADRFKEADLMVTLHSREGGLTKMVEGRHWHRIVNQDDFYIGLPNNVIDSILHEVLVGAATQVAISVVAHSRQDYRIRIFLIAPGRGYVYQNILPSLGTLLLAVEAFNRTVESINESHGIMVQDAKERTVSYKVNTVIDGAVAPRLLDMT